MLEIKDLCVSYGAIDAVKGISLKVNDGEIVSLIGANGAGKTTTLHTITGLVPAKSGSITYDGHDLLKNACEQDRHAGHGPCAGRPPRVHPHERAGEPRDGRVQSQRPVQSG